MHYIMYTSISHILKHLFNTGASINAISFKVYSSMQQKAKLLPTNRKVVSADSDRLGPIGEVHLKFKVGKIELNDAFVILDQPAKRHYSWFTMATQLQNWLHME